MNLMKSFNKLRQLSTISQRFFTEANQQQKKKILVTGSSGQIGTALVPKLYERYGIENVICSDIGEKLNIFRGDFEKLDVTDYIQYKYLMEKHEVNCILHFASILSASGEKNPFLAGKVNIEGVINALTLAREHKAMILIPSTIAVFGPECVKENVPNYVPLQPTTVYGATKVFMENLGNYYNYKHGVDFRSARLPGVVSPFEFQSNGSTDWATEMFFSALRKEKYRVCIGPDRRLPMGYLDDILDGLITLLEADETKFSTRMYNIQGPSFSPDELGKAIKKLIPSFEWTYDLDFRDNIVQTWPSSIDDAVARKDWGWNPECNSVDSLAKKMLDSIDKSKL